MKQYLVAGWILLYEIAPAGAQVPHERNWLPVLFVALVGVVANVGIL